MNIRCNQTILVIDIATSINSTTSKYHNKDLPRTTKTYGPKKDITEKGKVSTISPQRIEYSEDERGDISWRCPPDENNQNNFNISTFKWIKLSVGRKALGSAPGLIVAQTSVMQIKDPGRADEGRYACVTWSDNVARTIYFYQFIILGTKRVHIDSSKNISIYLNQNLDLSCPPGTPLIRNGHKMSSSHTTIKPRTMSPIKDTFQCSSSHNNTIRISITQSSANCSLSLLGCVPPSTQVNRNNNKCVGQVFIRYSYDSHNKMCLPFESLNCDVNLDSFDTLTACLRKYYSSSRGSIAATKPSAARTKRITKNVDHTVKTMVKTTVLSLNISERFIDQDPCFGRALAGTCDYGLHKQGHALTRYTFKPEYGQCHRVSYTGCQPGQNLFDDSNDCKSACEYRLYNSLKSTKCQTAHAFNCVQDSGSSTNSSQLTRFQYSLLENKCVSFQSKDSSLCLLKFFDTLDDCQKICHRKPASENHLQNKCFGKVVVDDRSCTSREKVRLWFYMSSIGQCLQYSTCQVQSGGNAFVTKTACLDSCLATNIYTVCSLAMDPGSGDDLQMKYFFDSRRKKCRMFQYKGRLGNLNRFVTFEECTETCAKRIPGAMAQPSRASALTQLMPLTNADSQTTLSNMTYLNLETDRDSCYDKVSNGVCPVFHALAYSTRYFYNNDRRRCESFMFWGCGPASRNSFDTKSICDRVCTKRIQSTRSQACLRHTVKCSNSSWIYWRYSVERGVCELFQSCTKLSSGNEPLFGTEELCTQACAPRLPLRRDLFDVCHLPPNIVPLDTKNCSSLIKRWFYDESNERCKEAFSCASYGNNFVSESSCLSTCRPGHTKATCRLSVDRGSCPSNVTMYHYHWSSRRCIAFLYGGCLGNRNRFTTIRDCYTLCSSGTLRHGHLTVTLTAFAALVAVAIGPML